MGGGPGGPAGKPGWAVFSRGDAAEQSRIGSGLPADLHGPGPGAEWVAGGGDGDAGITVVGLMAGAAISHNWGLAGAAGLVADGKGASTNAQIAVIIGLVVSLVISVAYTRRNAK